LSSHLIIFIYSAFVVLLNCLFINSWFFNCFI